MTTSDSDRVPEAAPTTGTRAGDPGAPSPEVAGESSEHSAVPEGTVAAAPAPPAESETASPAPSAPPAPPLASPSSPGSAGAGTPDPVPSRRARPSWLATTSSPAAGHDDDLESTAVRRQGLLTPTTPRPRPDVAPSPAAAEADTDRTAALPAGPARPEREPEEAGADAALLDGATYVRPPSRAWAHALTPFLTLLLVPIAWYLVADGGARLAIAQTATPGQLALWPVVEVLAGIALAAGIVVLTRWSALGAVIVGALVTLASAPFLLAPGWATDLVAPLMTWLENLTVLDALGPNIAYHLQTDALVGRMSLYGVGLLVVGIVVLLARRAGRDDQRAEEAYARSTNRPRA